MSSGSARRGRRDNGLDAAEYAAAGDVDPRVGEHLLDVLALQGIAAYLQPAVDLNPVTRSAVMPSRPTDRLFVDRVHLTTARDYLAQLAEPRGDTTHPARGNRPRRDRTGDDRPLRADEPFRDPTRADEPFRDPTRADEPFRDPTWDDQSPADRDRDHRSPADRDRDDRSPADRDRDHRSPGDRDHRSPGDRAGDEGDGEVDDAWAAIVAGYDTEVDASVASWPEAENVDVEPPPAEKRGEGDDDRPPPARPSWEGEPSLLTALDTFGMDLPDDPDDEEGYTPPPPPPLPRISKYAVVGVLAIVAGFILFIKPSLLPIDSDVSMLIGFTAILAGFGLLVWRLRPGDDGDDYDPDDGARV